MILPLYLYDHSGITMNTCGFSCPWDSGQVGWIYADKAMIEQEHGKITPEILEKVRQTLEAEVKEYDYYLTNQCYGFQLFKEDVEVDSCWGFLGEIRDVQDAVKEHLPEDCNPAIVESLQFQYEELDIDEYLERLQEETEGLDCELDNTVNVFILYGCTLSKERSSMRIVAATTDEEMLHTIIGAQILGGTMDYRGFSNMKGFEQFRAACRAGDVQYSNLDYGFVEQTENLMLPDCAKEPQFEKAYRC